MSIISDAIKRSISRRTFLKGAGSIAAVPILTGLGGAVLSGCASDSKADSDVNTKLVILGSSGGVGYWPGSDRASSSAALVVKGTIYLIDLGQGATYRLNQAFNSASLVDKNGNYLDPYSSTFLGNIKALFFTHLHQDHVADYANLLLIGAGSNLGSTISDSQDSSTNNGLAKRPLQVIGPCDRGQLDINNNPYWTDDWLISTDSSNPSKITPTPGTQQMTDLILQAFAQAANDIMMDDGYPSYKSLVQVKEIGTGLKDPNDPTCPLTKPFPIYQDDNVSVKATLVDHRQVYPAFAYRFDTPDGSVVFSGDTGPNTTADRNLPKDDPALAHGNLQELADGADILVHEVIDTAWIDAKFPKKEMAALKTHMQNAHTQIERVGQVAAYCNVKTLVINHIVPGMAPISHLRQAQQNFPGNLIISEDLMRIGVSKAGGVVL